MNSTSHFCCKCIKEWPRTQKTGCDDTTKLIENYKNENKMNLCGRHNITLRNYIISEQTTLDVFNKNLHSTAS